ncbi:MAG: DUF488 family protein [Chloroflexota bacterium]
MSIVVKRVYDQHSTDDGYRILVDRLWPRGVSHEMAHLDLWMRDIAPTTELRKWYDHQVERWPEFQKRYTVELAGHGALLDLLLDIERHRRRVTLLFAARDRDHNEAQVVASALAGRSVHAHH